MRLPHISDIAALFFLHIQQSAHIAIFPHKLAFSTAILILFVLLLRIYVKFCYLDHLVDNRMAPHVSGPLWNEMG